MKLPIACLVSLTAIVVQSLKQRREAIEIFQTGNIFLAVFFRFSLAMAVSCAKKRDRARPICSS